jgi:hypothetical protein
MGMKDLGHDALHLYSQAKIKNKKNPFPNFLNYGAAPLEKSGYAVGN